MRISRALAMAAMVAMGLCGCASETTESGLERNGAGSSPESAASADTEDDLLDVTAPAEPPAVPAPAPAPKTITPITLYTVSGTSVPAREGYQADIAKALDPNVFTWEPIDYPAALMPMDASVNQGVASLVARINARPGKFALVGFSQGSIVISRVYEALRAGGLQSRRGDLVAGVAVGNPMREVGRNIPNGVGIPGHGMMGERLSGTEDLWWEICAPNDLVCSTGDDPAGFDRVALFEVVRGRAPAPANIVQNVIGILMNPLQVLQQLPGRATGLQQLLAYLVPGGGNGAHGSYPIFQPIPGNPKNSLELAVQYLNEKAVNQ